MTTVPSKGFDHHNSAVLQHTADAVIARIEKLKESEDLFHSSWEDNPRPCWLKWVRSDRMLMGRVNAAYTHATGITVRAYNGEEDDKLWGEDQTFNAGDREVIRTRMRVKIAELAPNPLTGAMEYWVGWKWPYFARSTIIGIWGEAIPVPKKIYDEYQELIDYIVFKVS